MNVDNPTLKLIECAYPDGIPHAHYLTLLSILAEETSIRVLASVIAHIRGGNYAIYMNDVVAAKSFIPSDAVSQTVKGKLRKCGYETWLENLDKPDEEIESQRPEVKTLIQTTFIGLHENEKRVVYITMDDGAMIVPINADGRVLVHTEPSQADDGKRALFVPAGAIDEGEAPALCANREMQEEIGYKANQVDFLGVVDIGTKYIKCQMYLYLGRDLERSKLEGDEEDGLIQSHRPISLSEVEALMASGILRDSVTINALLLARQFIENEK